MNHSLLIIYHRRNNLFQTRLDEKQNLVQKSYGDSQSVQVHLTSEDLASSSLTGLSEFTSLTGEEMLSVSNRDYYIDDCLPLSMKKRFVFALEKHITVIKKGPNIPPY